MTNRAVTVVISALLIISVTISASLIIAPQRAVAQSSGAGEAGCLIGLAATIAGYLGYDTASVPTGDAPSQAADTSSSMSNALGCLYTTILVPAFRAAITQELQDLTFRTINWINGNGSGSGRSFVPNLSVHLQAVGDTVASAFLKQVAAGFQSPFDITIAASLRNQYLQQTSVAGFFSQYRSTLSQFSPNVNSFLAGNWSQGGVSAWLALTTQPQNNPYLLYQAAANQLATQEAAAQTNTRQDLLQSGGFLSFCPPGATSQNGAVSPQVQCRNAEGTPVSATTPGSVIASFLQANVDSSVAQLVNAKDIDSMISAVVGALVNKVMNSTGLFNTSGAVIRPGVPLPGGGTGTTTPGGNSSILAQIQAVLTNVDSYASSWSTVQTAAIGAQTSLNTLLNSCSAELSAGTIGTVAITTADEQTAYQAMNPFIQQAQTALANASTTRTFAQQVQSEVSNGTADIGKIMTDLSQLLTMHPSAGEIAIAQSNAQTTGQAHATPTGSVLVTGGSMIDQANLVATNANTLAPQCAGYTGSTGTGTGTGTGTTPINGGTLPNLYGSATTGQLIRYATPNANQPVCFNTALTQQDVGTTRMFFLTTDTSMYTGGNVTYWISNSFNGQPAVGSCNTLGQNLSTCTETTPFTFTKTMYLNVSSAGTYYWCMTLDTAGNKVGAELWPGNPPSGGA